MKTHYHSTGTLVDSTRAMKKDGNELREELMNLPGDLREESVKKRLAMHGEIMAKLGNKREDIPVRCIKIAAICRAFSGADTLSPEQIEVMFPLLKKWGAGEDYVAKDGLNLSECARELTFAFRPHKELAEGVDPETVRGQPAQIDYEKALKIGDAKVRVKQMLGQGGGAKKAEESLVHKAALKAANFGWGHIVAELHRVDVTKVQEMRRAVVTDIAVTSSAKQIREFAEYLIAQAEKMEAEVQTGLPAAAQLQGPSAGEGSAD